MWRFMVEVEYLLNGSYGYRLALGTVDMFIKR